MKVSAALKALRNGDSIIARDKTFEPHNVDIFKLETGERIFWIEDGEAMWMAIDEESEEVLLFNEIDADFDPMQESVFYAGADYELTVEVSATVLDEEEEETDKVDMKDFERSDGEKLRVMEFEVTGDIMRLVGWKLAEEELREI